MEIFGHLSVWIRRKIIEMFTTDSDGNTAINVSGEVDSNILNDDTKIYLEEISNTLIKNHRELIKIRKQLELISDEEIEYND